MDSVIDLAAQAQEYIESGNLDDAERIYRKMLTSGPANAHIHHVLGLIYYEQKRYEQARRQVCRAIEINPEQGVYWRSLGDIIQALGNVSSAIENYEKSLLLAPHDPDTLLNLGNALHKTGNSRRAIEHFRHVFNQHPDHFQAANNIGKIYYDQGDIKESLTWYGKALTICPDYAEAHFNRAAALLASGDYACGWPAYEWRFKRTEAARVYPHRLNAARWDGASFKDKRLLVHCEQGMGDVLQFCRYLPMVKTMGGHLIAEVQRPLQSLIERMEAIDEVIAYSQSQTPQMHYRYYYPLLSLPLIFKTTLDTIPDTVPYLFASPEKIARWKTILNSKGLRAGLVWSGSDVEPNRSCSLSDLAPLWQIEHVQLYSLQTGPVADEIEPLEKQQKIISLGSHFKDFDDTAAAIANLDLVISIDTAAAHLAGAMGKPVWILLPKIPDWRWMQDGSKSPWYPTARLFRQKQTGQWPCVIREAAQALRSQTAIEINTEFKPICCRGSKSAP
ncbi:MAG: tetratricopeptide repeat protein [Desulfobacteraceae bacterium]|nr:tetratricopeptide repeat protein [Desulfobacteraceae bacterium]